MTHDLSHISFLTVCSYPIIFFFELSNELQHFKTCDEFRNSAVLRLRIFPLLRLDYFRKNIRSCSALCFQMRFLYTLQKLKTKQPRRERLNYTKEVNKVAVNVDIFLKLKIFILFHNLLLLTVTSFICFSIDDRFIIIC